MDNYRPVSFWFDSLDDPVLDLREPPAQVDVAIIGAGFTGLWTAYYLKKKQPRLQIAVFEAETVGFGASGRNGGWCMGTATGIEHMLSVPSLQAEGIRLQQALENTVDEIERVCQAESIDCHFARGGTLNVAGTPEVAKRSQQWVEHLHRLGFKDSEYCWLDQAQSEKRIGLSRNLGAYYTTHCAAIHPGRLVRGLAEVNRALGVQIIEKAPVFNYTRVPDGSLLLSTGRGAVRAEKIIRATEGYTESIQGQQRSMLPLYSMVVATEPLSPEIWQEIGLTRRETFGDGRRVVIYGQRTVDDRLVFGGRAGYYFGSKRRALIPATDKAVKIVEASARELIPALRDPALGETVFSHGWGGLMGVPRHWRPCVTFDERSRIGWAGGYTGEGVGASNLAGRIMCDLVAGEKSDLTTLAWVDDVPRRWEPEPIRWLGVKSIEFFGDRADRREANNQSAGIWGSLFNRFVG